MITKRMHSHKCVRTLTFTWIVMVLLAACGAVLAGCAGIVAGNTSTSASTSLTILNPALASDTTSAAAVTWQTNIPATSQVDYGTTTSYGSTTAVDSTMVTSHQVTLSGLAAGTTYYYQVSSTDSNGNHGHSGGHSFKTNGYNISGAISPSAGGSGATVTLSGGASASTTADSSGNYTFTGLPNAMYSVTPSHNGYAFSPSTQSVAVNGANATGVNFTDTAQTFSISGTISPTAGGSGASVTLSGASGATTVANTSGVYTFTGLVSGSYVVTPSNAGYTFTPPSQSATVSTTNVSGMNFTANAIVVAPTIATQPGNQTVTAGQTASFSVAASGTAPLSYQWQKNGVNISGATAASYTTPATTTSDSGSTFRALVSNTAGNVTSSAATLTVNAAPVAPTVTTQPASQTVTAGQTVAFTVVASGTAPLSYQWQKNGANISGATAASYTTPATTTSDTGSTFDVVVSNIAGAATSSAATLTVNAAALAPTITTQPTSQTVTAGQTAIFAVVASGTAPMSYQWQKNGVNISGATSASYSTPATTTSDSGSTFRAVVSNAAGNVTSSAATLTVNAAPVAPTVTTQPASQTVTAGQAASFSVVASGTAPLSYQWQKNGVNITGATSASYTTPVTTTSDSGSTFRAVVSNTAGTATSSSATLTVNAPPAPAIQVSSTSINFSNDVVGTTLSQLLIITNAGTATLSITQINESGAAFSVSGFSLPVNVAAGSQTTISVAFLPTSVGTVSGSISIVSNAPTSPTAISLTGTGIASSQVLSASPSSVSFANVGVGQSSTQQVTITNSGNSNVTVSSVTVSGAGLSASGLNAGTTLTPNQTAALSVSFAPTASGTINGSVVVASNASNSPTTISVTATGTIQAAGAPLCGMQDDGQVHIPLNYTTFVPPAKGGSYTDPTFGCVIHRLTDFVADNPEGNGTSDPPVHYYNSVSPFNSNDSYVILRGADTGGWWVVDLNGNKVIDHTHMPCIRSAQPLWAFSDPNSFYYTGCDNVLRQFTITGTNTGNITVLHTFSEYSNLTNTDASDLSQDGDHLLLVGMHTGANGAQVPLDIFTYSLSQGTKSFLYTTVSCVGTVGNTLGPQPDGDCIHKMEITTTNQGVVQWNGSTCPECNSNQTIINSNGTITKILDSIHFMPGWDITGTHPLLALIRDDYHGDPCWNGGGLTALYLDTMTDHCLYSLDYKGGHVSYGGGPNQPWILYDEEPVNGVGYLNGSTSFVAPVPCILGGAVTSSGCWWPFSGELFLVRVDSVGNTNSQGGTSSKVYRLAHSRSRSTAGYWSQPRPTISRDGKYVIFDSNMAYVNGCPAATPPGILPGSDCTDVYWIKIQ